MSVALVTGGTSGIGLAFAESFATRGYDLVLVARNLDRLESTAAQLREKYRVDVETLVADLINRDDVTKVANRLEDPERPVDVLVNNAGFGVHVRLLEPDTTLQENAIAAMATAVLILSSAAGRAMVSRGKGTIINVSSASAFIATGNYSAIKRWVLTFTEALALELEGTGVQATAVCPGWAKTEFHARTGTKRPNLPGWLWVKPEEVAEAAIKAAATGKVMVVPKLPWKIAIFVADHGPKGILRAVSRKISRSRGHRK